MNFPDYPFNSHFLEVNGHKLHYLDEGDKQAEPVVMLHGNPSWSFYYRRLVTGLKDDYRCIVPDHIGMGLSDKPLKDNYDFHFSQRVKDLSDLLTQLDINENITLVLHDWGGMIGMLYACQNLEKIKRLIVLNTGAFHLPEDKALPFSIRLGHTPIINSILVQGLNAFCKGAVKHCVTRPMTPEVARVYLAPYNNWHNRLAVRKFVEDIPLSPKDRGYDDISKINHDEPLLQSIPKLICWGMKDFVFDETFLRKWQSFYPDAEVHRFKNAGHYVLEDAADEIISLARKFLASNPV